MTQKNQTQFLSLHKVIAIIGIIIGASYYLSLWQFGPDGLSGVSSTTAYWDFNNLWVGGHFAITGHVDWLFNMDIYRPEMDNLLGLDVPDQEWSYPPNILLIGAPLAMLPILPAYILWSLGSLILLHFSIKPLQLPPFLHLAILLSPAIFFNAVLGQNGTLISALLITGLLQTTKRPVLAGVCFGLMTIKPQFGLLLPFILIASGNWKVFGVAAITAISMAIATGVFFGFDIWHNFMLHTQPMMRAIMEAEYYQAYQANAITPFIFARALGASLLGAYTTQGIMSVLAIIIAMWLWRPTRDIAPNIRAALTMVLVIIATPYAYTYDLVAVYTAIIIFIAHYKRLYWQPLFVLIWLFPLFNHMLSWKYQLNISMLVILPLFGLLYLTWRDGTPKTSLGSTA